jgi:hypothetical protein
MARGKKATKKTTEDLPDAKPVPNPDEPEEEAKVAPKSQKKGKGKGKRNKEAEAKIVEEADLETRKKPKEIKPKKVPSEYTCYVKLYGEQALKDHGQTYVHTERFTIIGAAYKNITDKEKEVCADMIVKEKERFER